MAWSYCTIINHTIHDNNNLDKSDKYMITLSMDFQYLCFNSHYVQCD